MTIDYSGQLWLYWTLWSTDRWSTDQSALDISPYKYVTVDIEMKTGNPFAVAAKPVFNLCNEGGKAISNPWTGGATVDTAALKEMKVGTRKTVSLPLNTESLKSIFYGIIMCDNCGAGQIVIRDLRLTADDRTVTAPAEDLVLDLAGLGAGNNVTAKTYDKETNTVTIDYSGQLWLYWTLWSTDRWSTDQSALDISPYKYVTVDIEMKTGNPFAVAAKPVFNLCNEGGKAISNPWTGGATVDTAALKEMKVGTRKTVSLPLNTESLKSIFYGIIMCDNCGAGQIVIRDLRLTADDRTVTAPAEDLVLDLAGLGAGNNVTAKTYDKETNTVTIDYSGQLWLYWTLWSTDRWSTDQSALDISPYKYVTVDIEMKTGNPFAVAAKPVFNLCNEGGKAISNPWTGGATVDTAALKEMKVGTRKTVSLPLNTESLKSIFYGIIMCDNCGAGQIVIRDLRLTADDRTVTAPAEDLVLDLAGLGAGNNVTAKTYDKETNTVTIDYSGQLWLYWTLWSTDRWSTDQSALDISPYKYVTVDIEMKTGKPVCRGGQAGVQPVQRGREGNQQPVDGRRDGGYCGAQGDESRHAENGQPAAEHGEPEKHILRYHNV